VLGLRVLYEQARSLPFDAALRVVPERGRHAETGSISGQSKAPHRNLRAPRRSEPGYKRWSEKFITLTAPHPPTDTVTSRIDRVARAFPHLLKQLNAWLSERNAHTASAWLRVHEWTIGSDGLGHPHIHLWFFGPFLQKYLLDDWWRHALNSTGTIALSVTDSAHTFITNPESQGQVAQELIKYLTKDIDACGRKIPPEVYAEVYAAYSQRLATQASSGFKADTAANRRACLKCGDTSPPKVHPPAKAASLRRKLLIEELGAALIDAPGAELNGAERARALDQLSTMERAANDESRVHQCCGSGTNPGSVSSYGVPRHAGDGSLPPRQTLEGFARIASPLYS
jgi:hypothetical protein